MTMSGGVPSIRVVFFGSAYLLDLLERSDQERQAAPPPAPCREDRAAFYASPPPYAVQVLIRSRWSARLAEGDDPRHLTPSTLTWECPRDWQRRVAEGDPLYYRCATPLPAILQMLQERGP